MKDIATALAKAQAEVKAALKDSNNPHFKSRYADLTSVWDACRSALTKNGLSVVQRTDFNETDVWLETMLLHSSGEHIAGRYPLRPQQSTPQGYGSALTYARRYALAAMVGVVADEDDDGNAASHVAAPAPTSRKHEADPTAKAREWANNAHAALAKMKFLNELNVWLDSADNAKKMAYLQKELPDEFAALDDKVNVTADRLNSLVAG